MGKSAMVESCTIEYLISGDALGNWEKSNSGYQGRLVP